VYRKIASNPTSLELTDIFGSNSATQASVAEAGFKLIAMLYGSNPNQKIKLPEIFLVYDHVCHKQNKHSARATTTN